MKKQKIYIKLFKGEFSLKPFNKVKVDVGQVYESKQFISLNWYNDLFYFAQGMNNMEMDEILEYKYCELGIIYSEDKSKIKVISKKEIPREEIIKLREKLPPYLKEKYDN